MDKKEPGKGSTTFELTFDKKWISSEEWKFHNKANRYRYTGGVDPYSDTDKKSKGDIGFTYFNDEWNEDKK